MGGTVWRPGGVIPPPPGWRPPAPAHRDDLGPTILSIAVLGTLALGAGLVIGHISRASAPHPVTRINAPGAATPAPVVCTLLVDFGPQGQVIEQAAGSAGSVDCQRIRVQVSATNPNAVVSFTQPFTSPPACATTLNGITWRVWADSRLDLTQRICSTLTTAI